MSIVTKEWTKKFEEAEYLDEIIEGLEALQKENNYSDEEMDNDLDVALWRAYVYNNMDSYEYYELSEKTLAKVKDKGVKSGVWCYRYSCALVYLRRFEEALEYSRLGTKVEPDYPWGWLQLGRLCYKFNLLDEAFNAIEEGLKLVPNDYEFLTLKDDIENDRGYAYANSHYINEEYDKSSEKRLIDIDDDKLILSSENRVFKMNYEKANQYPLLDYQFKDDLKEIELEKCFTNELFKHIKFVAKKGKDNRNILQRIGFKEDIVVATDGYRLIKTDLIPYIRNGNNFIENEFSVNVEVVKFIQSIKEDILSIQYNENDENVRINLTNNIVILSKKVDDNYPDTSRLIPTTFAAKVVIDSNKMLNYHKELNDLSSEKQWIVDLDLKQNTLCLDNPKIDYSIGIENDLMENSFNDVISYDCKYMIDILENLIGDMSINLQGGVNGKLKPMIIKDGGNSEYILLPVRRY